MQVDHTRNFVIQNPCTPSEFQERDSMLAASLRDHPISWDYGSEYPLVLNTSNRQTSWCVFTGHKLAAHASLWPRTLTHITGSKSLLIGLVGNVATHPDSRRSGIMSALFEHLIKTAKERDLQALVLWSDLVQFYQKLGFSSIGRELRLTIRPNDKLQLTDIERADPSTLSSIELETMLSLRPKLEWSIRRSAEEFKLLMSIPNTAVFLRRHGKKIVSWLAIGKGSDLQGVIHEWGASSPAELLQDIQTILAIWTIPELTLLAPIAIEKPWIHALKTYSYATMEHPMALALALGTGDRPILPPLSRSFFWGFDSI